MRRIIGGYMSSRGEILRSLLLSWCEILMTWIDISSSQVNRKNISKTILIHGVFSGQGERIAYCQIFSIQLSTRKYLSVSQRDAFLLRSEIRSIIRYFSLQPISLNKESQLLSRWLRMYFLELADMMEGYVIIHPLIYSHSE